VERRSRPSKQEQVYQQKQHVHNDNDSNNQQQAASTAGLALLQECHPWCDSALLQEVLVSVDGDVAAALDALEQMLPADGSSHRQQQQPGGSQRSSIGSSSSTNNTNTRPSAAAAAADSSAALQLWPAGPDEESGAAAETQIAQQLERLHLQQQPAQSQQQQHQKQPRQEQQQQQQSAGRDTYHALRGDAVKLSHKYAKASKR
jgi:hypothetical protein